MTDLFTVARKEFLDLRRDRLFLIVISFLTAVTLVSVAVGAADFRAQLEAYNRYVADLAAAGTGVVPAAPQLFPLQLLRGGIEYLEILGALFAIVLGYGTVAKEKHRGTLQLFLSRPVSRFAFAGGKVAGLSAVWLGVVLLLTAFSTIAVITIGGGAVTGVDLGRLAITACFMWLYLVFWTALAVGLTSLAARLSTGLIVALVVWLAFVLVIPQIGDTMDPDNQVPGGLFAALQIKKSDELGVLAQFAGFDGIRNGLEVSSITKHFERLSFAFLGIKAQYNGQSIPVVWAAMLPYAITLTVATIASVIFSAVATTRRTLQRKQS
ncbi:MAG: ABC transporter permease [Cryobacterium sp.]|uniref:ABC transporter permease n=1 Tax=Cryobacterium sp. TaxID=1926290 RepID=UPI00229B08B5|nr:ABC transporter permease subunit [Cryobacterium sp.]MCY7403070.1 ABC transporter permease [Cryobacterium sp.]